MWNLIARILARPTVANWIIKRAMRTPYSPIVKNGKLYMERFWLFNPYPDTHKRWQFPISIRVHHILLPDQDRHLHDHPWNARTVILRGWYVEERQHILGWIGEDYDSVPGPHKMLMPSLRKTGESAEIAYNEYHRILMLSRGGCWTLFITGCYRGTWGFDVDGKKVTWRKYLGME